MNLIKTVLRKLDRFFTADVDHCFVEQIPYEFWSAHVNKVRQGQIAMVDQVDEYDDMLVIHLKDGLSPLVLPSFRGVPIGLKSWPMENDRLLIEGIGHCIPIVYNETTKSQMFSNYMDTLIVDFFKINGVYAEFEDAKRKWGKASITMTLFEFLRTPLYHRKIRNQAIKLFWHAIHTNSLSEEICLSGVLQFQKQLDGEREKYTFLRVKHNSIGALPCFHAEQTTYTQRVSPLMINSKVTIRGQLYSGDWGGIVVIRTLWNGSRQLILN